MKIFDQVKAVLWSFIGLGGRNRADLPKVNPLAVIAIAFVLVALFLGTLAFIVKQVVAAG